MNVEQLAAEGEWDRIAASFEEPGNMDQLVNAADSLLSAGTRWEEGDDRIRALHCYRLAVWALARHRAAAPDHAQNRERWFLLQAKGWKFHLAHRKHLEARGPSHDADGRPLTVEAHWADGWVKLEELARAGDYPACEKLLVLLEALPSDDGDQVIRNAGIFETIGDRLAEGNSNPDAARWFYQHGAAGFDNWVSSSSSGGEGSYRSGLVNEAEGKLQKLGGPLPT